MGSDFAAAVIAKIMESIISDEIRKLLLANNVLSAEQHGFVPKSLFPLIFFCITELSDSCEKWSAAGFGAESVALYTYIADFKTDDLKIYNESPTSCSILSKDILIVNQWSMKWTLPINNQKCSVLHIGPNNSKYVYSMDGVTSTTDLDHIKYTVHVPS
ncbi:hypothetical protein Zmor_026918 [Zophobas morio]|uniref:Reverse transcriptase domain-containing protein n=1 Tax=Zophobas morio TaxID=2755281 RepID=A0AA38HVI7_9CUCU|nr:hypothetical protein Zmor_026918 [Zophobas morio]